MTLTTTDNISHAMAELENANKLIDSLMKVPHYQKMGVDAIHLVVAKARSLNLDPLYALNGALYVVKGKIGMVAEAMAAMIREKGHSIIKDKCSNKSSCVLHGKRMDNGDTWTTSFSIEDAQRAGIYGDTWKKYPDIMCYNRAMSILARQLFPDIIKGCGYTKEELYEATRDKNELQEVSVEEVKPEIMYVTKNQVDGIENLLSTCSEDYQRKIAERLRKLNPAVLDLNKLPADLYQKLYDAIQKESKSHSELMLKYADEPTQTEEVANVA